MKTNLPDAPAQIPDLAVSLGDGGKIWAASCDAAGVVHALQFAADNEIAGKLAAWREELGQTISPQTPLRLAENYFTALTHIASLSDEVLSLSDEALVEMLVAAANEETTGEDGYPLFASSLENTVYDFARTPEGSITLTALPVQIREESVKEINSFNLLNAPAGDQPDYFFETRIRAVARFLICEFQQTAQPAEEGATLILAFTKDGATFALWNERLSFHYELGEVLEKKEVFDTFDAPPGMLESEYADQQFASRIDSYLNESVCKYLFPEGGEPIRITRIFAAFSQQAKAAAPVVARFADTLQIPYTPSPVSFGEAVVRGLLMGNDDVATDLVPQVNLGFDLLQQHNAENDVKIGAQVSAAGAHQRVTLFALLLPLIMTLGIIGGLYADTFRAGRVLTERDQIATAEQNRLEPKLKQRALYEKTLTWYQDILKQIPILHQKQTLALAFPFALDAMFPKDSDFVISDMSIKTGGAFELKGATRKQLDVTDFYNRLEYFEPNLPIAPAAYDLTVYDPAKDRAFQNLQLEFKQGSGLVTSGAQTSAAAPMGNVLSRDVSAFVIRGMFKPLAVLKSSQATAANVPAPAAVSQPAAPPIQNAPTGGAK